MQGSIGIEIEHDERFNPSMTNRAPRAHKLRAIGLGARSVDLSISSISINRLPLCSVGLTCKYKLTIRLHLRKQLSPTSSFTTDLGLDSLDAVEVVMAIEEEFAIEIPDEDADAITSVGQGESWWFYHR